MDESIVVPHKRKEAEGSDCRPDGESSRNTKQPAVSRDLLGLEMKPDDLPDSLFLDQSKRKLQTHKVEKSPLLSKLGSFLPTLQQANSQLEKKLHREGAAAVTIEDVDTNKPHIAMDLALGVSDDPSHGLPGGEAVPVAEQEDEEEEDKEEDDADDDDDDREEEEGEEEEEEEEEEDGI